MGQPVAIVNELREIVYANRLLQQLTQANPFNILGQLPGDALSCVHAATEGVPCGASEACRQCGTLQAVEASQNSHSPATCESRMTVRKESGEASLEFEITASPLDTGQPLTIVSFRDVSAEKRRNVLERVFFHDLLNLSGGLHGLLEIWPDLDGSEADSVRRMALDVSAELSEEIVSGRALAAAERGDLEVVVENLHPGAIMESVAAAYRRHSVTRSRAIHVDAVPVGCVVRTDQVLLRRILGNLVKNALEATSPDGTVTLAFHAGPEPCFEVHNREAMPLEVSTQIFQRSFSTKSGTGRGIGTYSVKLLTERYLRGQVTFTTSPAEGTTFRVRLPAQ
jgi:signal transduction histidine kinase